MNYFKIYYNLTHNKHNNDNLTYSEAHHIIPKCMGGTDEPTNIVKLSLREHYLAHKLLCEMYPDSKPLAHALWMMTICTIGAMEHYIENNIFRSDGYLIKRTKAYQNNENIKISSREYEYARSHFKSLVIGVKRTKEQCEKISNATKNAMRTQEMIEKCKSNKGTHYYHNILTGEVKKWFPGDPEIDLSTYAWGRGPISKEQKNKLSSLKNLKKEYYYIEGLNIKYTKYIDYIKSVPENWTQRWVNSTNNKKLKNYIINAIRSFNLNTAYKYENKIAFNIPNRSKNSIIITPALYECCYNILLKFNDTDITEELARSIETNIENILKLNEKYLNLEKLSI